MKKIHIHKANLYKTPRGEGGNFNPPTERYWELMKESQIKGYLFQQQNYLPGDENPGG